MDKYAYEITPCQAKTMSPDYVAGLVNHLRSEILSKDAKIAALQSELAYLMKAGKDE